MTRNGKIARLPHAIREELNHRLLSGGLRCEQFLLAAAERQASLSLQSQPDSDKASAPNPQTPSSKGSISCSPQLILHITGMSSIITNYHQISPKHFLTDVALPNSE